MEKKKKGEKAEELFEAEALERTFIRATVNGELDAHSFKELSETEDGRKVLRDLLHKRIDDLLWETDLNEGKKCSEESWAVNVARLIEHLCGPLVKVSREVFDEQRKRGER